MKTVKLIEMIWYTKKKKNKYGPGWTWMTLYKVKEASDRRTNTINALIWDIKTAKFIEPKCTVLTRGWGKGKLGSSAV